MSRSVIKEVITSANGIGLWQAKVIFRHTLSENDPRREFNLQAQIPNIRRAARKAILDELVIREQKTNESETTARSRISKAIGHIVIIDSGLDAMNLWHSITFSESTKTKMPNS